MDNPKPSRDSGGRRRAAGSWRGSHRAGSRDAATPGAGRHRASGFDLPFNPSRLHIAVAVAGCLVVAAGVAIGTSLLRGDDPGYSAGNEADAPLLYSGGEPVPDDFTDRHRGLTDLATAELDARYGIGVDELYDADANPGGYRVALTLDRGLQEAAEGTSPAAVIAVEPGSGAVLCYSGAEEAGEVDQLGDDAPHPPASVFDMVTAATALEAGASTGSWWPGDDADVTLGEAVREGHGAAIDAVAEQYGSETVIDTAIGMGLTSMVDDDGTVHDFGGGDAEDPDAFDPSDFGSYAVTVADMATVYATIANDGVHAQPHLIDRVVDGTGNTVQASQGIPTDQNITAATARDLQDVGLDNGDPMDGDYFGLAGNWNDGPAQSWYVGAIPQLAVAAWSGEDEPGESIWRHVVEAAIDVMDYEPTTWAGAAGAGSDLTDGIENDDGSIDPDSEYCQADPEAEPCVSDEPGDEPSDEPSSDEPPDDPPSDEPTDDEPSEEPSPDPTEPSEEPTDDDDDDDDCDWLDPTC